MSKEDQEHNLPTASFEETRRWQLLNSAASSTEQKLEFFISTRSKKTE